MAKLHSNSAKRKIIMNELLGFFLLFIMSLCCDAASKDKKGMSLGAQKVEVQKHLNRLNKPAIMSIKSADGDTIDCVHISHQPAFDHPLLKNLTIQMTPNYHPERLFRDGKLSIAKATNVRTMPITQLWHFSGKCPEGTVPIRRTKKDDILRAGSMENFGRKKKLPTISNLEFGQRSVLAGHEHAVASVSGDKYYGASATINLWEPKVQQLNEFSLSQLWILGGTYNTGLNSIEAGWQVCPVLYGDHNTRLFVYWTRDAYQTTGCYNLLCSGFIQTSKEIALGASLAPLSNYDGSQKNIGILIWKDPNDGNWWMQLGDNHILGYWPAYLFTYLRDSASIVDWGGEVVNLESDGLHTTTQMGSGLFPNEGPGKASNFRNIRVIDGSNTWKAPQDLSIIVTKKGCYDIQLGKDSEGGNYFYYGGPGRNPNCP